MLSIIGSQLHVQATFKFYTKFVYFALSLGQCCLWDYVTLGSASPHLREPLPPTVWLNWPSTHFMYPQQTVGKSQLAILATVSSYDVFGLAVMEVNQLYNQNCDAMTCCFSGLSKKFICTRSYNMAELKGLQQWFDCNLKYIHFFSLGVGGDIHWPPYFSNVLQHLLTLSQHILVQMWL